MWKSSKSGFTLVGALIATLAFMVGSLGILTLTTTTFRSQKHLDTKIELTSMLADIDLTLQDSELCKTAIVFPGNSPWPNNPPGPSGSTIPVHQVRPGTGASPIIESGQTTTTGLAITNLYLVAQAAPVSAGSDSTQWYKVVVQANRANLPATASSKLDVVSPLFKVVIDMNNRAQAKSCGRSGGSGITNDTFFFLKTSLVKTTTKELGDYYHLDTPLACPTLYAQESCGWIRDHWPNNLNTPCTYRFLGNTVTAEEWMAIKLIDLQRACYNFCVGLRNVSGVWYVNNNNDPAFGAVSVRASAGPIGSPAAGNPYTGGIFNRCGNDTALDANGRRWSEIYCECHK